MREYEALYIMLPEMEEGDIQTTAKSIEDLVTSNGGAVVRSEIWGKRKLAYEVKKHTEGVYVLLRFQAEPDFIARLESAFKLSDQVLRYLVVYFDEHTLRLEAEQLRRREEDVRSGGPGRRGQHDDDDDEDDDRPPRRDSRDDDRPPRRESRPSNRDSADEAEPAGRA